MGSGKASQQEKSYLFGPQLLGVVSCGIENTACKQKEISEESTDESETQKMPIPNARFKLRKELQLKGSEILQQQIKGSERREKEIDTDK